MNYKEKREISHHLKNRNDFVTKGRPRRKYQEKEKKENIKQYRIKILRINITPNSIC